MITVMLDGYTGEGFELVSFEMTATGMRVVIRGALADALNANAR